MHARLTWSPPKDLLPCFSHKIEDESLVERWARRYTYTSFAAALTLHLQGSNLEGATGDPLDFAEETYIVLSGLTVLMLGLT